MDSREPGDKLLWSVGRDCCGGRPHYTTTLRLLADILKERGAGDITERSYVHVMYTESSGWIGNPSFID